MTSLVRQTVYACLWPLVLTLANPTVAEPVAVRYAWHETVIGNLGNAEGLPASPFRILIGAGRKARENSGGTR